MMSEAPIIDKQHVTPTTILPSLFLFLKKLIFTESGTKGGTMVYQLSEPFSAILRKGTPTISRERQGHHTTVHAGQ